MNVLKFQATWCSPCKQLSKVLAEPEFSTLTVTEVDIDSDPAAAAKYGIRGIPTLVVVDDSGAEISRVSGSLTKQKVSEFFSKLEAQ